MAKFYYPIDRRIDNYIFSGETITINYIFAGVNVNMFSIKDVDSATGTHQKIIEALAALSPTSLSIYGLLIPEPFSGLIRNYQRGFTNYTPGSPSNAAREKLVGDFARQLSSGELSPHRRLLWITFRTTVDAMGYDAGVNIGDPRDISIITPTLASLNESIHREISRYGTVHRTTPAHLRWLHDYARLIGFSYLPEFPDTPTEGDVDNNESTYPDFFVNRYPELSSTIGEPDNPNQIKKRKKRKLVKYLTIKSLNTFASRGAANILSVTTPEHASTTNPWGVTNYHSTLVIGKYPNTEMLDPVGFLAVADSTTDVFLNWSQHIIFDDAVTDINKISKTTSLIGSEDDTTLAQKLDEADREQEIADAIVAIRQDAGATGMLVSTFLNVIHPNAAKVSAVVRDWKAALHESGFSVTQPPLAQPVLFSESIPGGPLGILARGYMQATTSYWWAAMQPLRVCIAGDVTGIPLFVNKSNGLGQIVPYDILTGSDQTNAGINLFGRPGSGKSHPSKIIGTNVLADHGVLFVTDPGDHREQLKYYTVAAAGLTPALFDFKNPTCTIDPLVCIPDMEKAVELLIDIILTLTKTDPSSEKAWMLGELLTADNMRIKRIKSFVDLMVYMQKEPSLKDMFHSLMFYASLPFTSALFNPKNLPRFNIASQCVVVSTAEIKTRNMEKGEELGARNRFNLAMKEYIANLARVRISLERHTGAFCCLILEELGLENESKAIMDLHSEVDMIGRKGKVAVIVIEQDARGASLRSKQTPRKWVGAAADESAAEDSLNYIGTLPTDESVDFLTKECGTKKYGDLLDFTGAGLGFYRDVNGVIVRVKGLDIPDAQLKAASNTIASQMIR